MPLCFILTLCIKRLKLKFLHKVMILLKYCKTRKEFKCWEEVKNLFGVGHKSVYTLINKSTLILLSLLNYILQNFTIFYYVENANYYTRLLLQVWQKNVKHFRKTCCDNWVFIPTKVFIPSTWLSKPQFGNLAIPHMFHIRIVIQYERREGKTKDKRNKVCS